MWQNMGGAISLFSDAPHCESLSFCLKGLVLSSTSRSSNARIIISIAAEQKIGPPRFPDNPSFGSRRADEQTIAAKQNPNKSNFCGSVWMLCGLFCKYLTGLSLGGIRFFSKH